MKKTSRRGFGKQLTWALGAMSVSSLTAKTVRAQKGKDLTSDSPITVGGGGGIDPWVELTFDHNDFVPDPDDRDNFVNHELAFDYILVNGARTELPRKSEIVVEFKKGGSTRKITVAADPTSSKPLGVEFNGKHLRYNHQSKKHRDDGSVLKKVTINGVSTTLTTEGEINIHTEAA